jgi:TRAP-type C4-dicarboxylate transport system permease small subunit
MGRRIETALMSIILLGIVLLEALQIVLRNFFSYAIFWADELTRMGVLWLAVIGALAASREGRHLAIGIVPRYCPPSWHKPAACLASLFAGAVTALLAWHAFRFVADSYRFGDTVLGDWPAWVFQLVMPIGFSLISYRFVAGAVEILRRKS